MYGCPFCEDIGLAHAVQQKIGKYGLRWWIFALAQAFLTES